MSYLSRASAVFETVRGGGGGAGSEGGGNTLASLGWKGPRGGGWGGCGWEAPRGGGWGAGGWEGTRGGGWGAGGWDACSEDTDLLYKLQCCTCTVIFLAVAPFPLRCHGGKVGTKWRK